MTTATMSYEVAWTGQLTGIFTIGVSTIGGSDVLGGFFGGNVFDDITADVKECEIKRGRNNDMSAMKQGFCKIKLHDPTGKYNPENSASSLAGYLVPMRPLRVRATYSGTTYTLFYGYVAQIEYNMVARESTITAVDLFEWLSVYRPTITTQTNQRVETLIGLILDEIKWTDPAMRSLESGGDVIPSWSADGGTTCLGLIQTLLTTDLSVFYIDASGVATYKTRASRYVNSTPVATLNGAIVGDLRTSIEKDTIINGQYVLRTGGSAKFATNTASRKSYGYRDGTPITSANLVDDDQASSLANFLVGLNAQPRSPVRKVSLINRDATTLTQQLTRELGDLVTVTEPNGSTSVTGRIQAIEHIIRDNGTVHETLYSVQKSAINIFTIGVSTIGGADVIGY